MKYIGQEYQQLLSEQRRTYERIISNLKAHNDWLKDELKKYEKDQLEKEIEEYNRLENESSESCPGCDARISELSGQVEALKKENKSLKMSNGHLKSAKKAKRAKRSYKKNVVCICKDCKKYFQACRSDAMRCADCKRKRASELTKISRAKRKM